MAAASETVASSRSGAQGFDAALFHDCRQALGATWGEPLCYRAETGSTSDDALAAARAGAPSGSLFVAAHQRAGRGRSGRSWLSPEGAGLLFSVLLRPEGSVAEHAPLTLAVGLGVRAALAAEVPIAFGVKWPNDVLAAERKVAGVLCEAQLEAGRVAALAIGVGINVGGRPGEALPEATSLAELMPAGGALPEREPLLARVLANMERYVESCLEQGFARLGAEFASHDALRGRRVRVSGTAELSGVARGVGADGQLLIESDGVIVPVRSGTVRITPD